MSKLTQAERLTVSPQYLAGCIDCDGCFSIVAMKRSPRGLVKRHELRLQLSNTNLAILEAVRDTYGGFIKKSKPGNELHKPLYNWVTQGPTAEAVTREIMPYLIIKKPRAEVALELRSTFKKTTGEKVTDELYAIRERCYQKMKTLNMKGVVA